MNALLDKLTQDDFIWEALTNNLPGRVRRSATNFLNVDCPMCIRMGETPDRKQRCGLKREHQTIGVYCFNCGFKTKFTYGGLLSKNFKDLLLGFGLTTLEVNHLSFKAHQLKSLNNIREGIAPQIISIPSFQTIQLPPDTYSLATWAQADCSDEDFINCVAYADSRGGRVTDTVMWSPDEGWRNRMIIPFYFRGEIAGYTGRIVSGEGPKYKNHIQSDYIYNNHLLYQGDRKLILVEGVLDADAIGGISPLGAKLSPRQKLWIKESGKEVIVVPDPDKAGDRLIEEAVNNNWSVAFPKLPGSNWWEIDCKDCSEAVKRYGKLYTLRSIIETQTDNKLKINLYRKKGGAKS